MAPGLASALTAILGREVAPADVVDYAAAVVAHPAYTLRFTEELATPGIRVPVTADLQLWQEAVAVGREVIWLHTYGSRRTNPDRPEDDIRMPVGDYRQPLCTRAITAMPSVITYDAARSVLAVGDGEFFPVSREVWQYSVGGRNVIKSWFNYRKKDPGGKRNYPLDLVYPETWEPDWTSELIDLLTVLARLTTLEHAQAELMACILGGPLISAADLEEAGTRWPKTKKDRNPRHSYSSIGASTAGGQLPLEG